MARSKHRDGRRRSPVNVIRTIASTSAEAIRRVKTERRAYAAMPKPVPWDWAMPRLIPLLAGPYLDHPGESLVLAVLPPGVTVTFGIDLGRGVMPFVDTPVAERWECSPSQICSVAVDNLERRAAQIETSAVRSGTLSGHIVGVLQRPAWVSSLLLTTPHLVRLFGAQDQIFVAAGHGTLISLPIDAPSHVASELVIEYEAKEWYPLMLDPFGLEGGVLHWGGAEEYEADDDDDDWVAVV
ncbi:MAG: hypothetical protein ACR2I5_03890 [Candidatus Limnocylindria bacterium]